MKVNMSKEIRNLSIFLVFIALAIAIYFYLDVHEKVSIDSIKEFVLLQGKWAPLIYMMTYIVTSLGIFPNLVLSMAAGAIWGPYFGTLYTVIGASAGSVLPFIISRRLGRSYMEVVFKKTKTDICDRFVSRNSFVAVLIARLIPFLPWELVNYGSGLCGIRLRSYLAATILGMIPASFAYNLIGASFGEPIDKTKIIILFVLVSLIAMATILYTVFQKPKRASEKG